MQIIKNQDLVTINGGSCICENSNIFGYLGCKAKELDHWLAERIQANLYEV